MTHVNLYNAADENAASDHLVNKSSTVILLSVIGDVPSVVSVIGGATQLIGWTVTSYCVWNIAAKYRGIQRGGSMHRSRQQ